MSQQGGAAPTPPQLSNQVSFGQWSQMSPEQRNAASAGWANDRRAVADYDQRMFEHYQNMDRMRQAGAAQPGQPGNIDTGIPQGPGVGGAPGGTPPGYTAVGQPAPPSRAPLGLGLGLRPGQRQAFQAAAQAG